ncbi:MAG: phosphatidylglycerol lysyltransferase domain-containing protein [Deltaproteobacteria bacterium]|jgi:hypothetical protein|nr:phosphatidylglycerol lysyltransferase domain-containing protein [Deltaproteobacteria bacterium]
MSFTPLTLEDREIFRAAEKACPLTTSDFNFTNMFIWNDYYHFTWKEAHGCLALIANPEGQAPFAAPPLGTGDQLKALEVLFSHLDNPILTRAPENLTRLIERERPNWTISPDPDNDDYVYLAEKLRDLSGRRMHQKKNHYNYFKQNYSYEMVDLTFDLIPELIAVEDLWLTAKTEKVGQDSHLIMERKAVHHCLDKLVELDLKGLAIRVDGKIEAFTLGEVLNADTAVIHVEKGNPTIRGIYVALLSEFCRRHFPTLTYVNREQDLGLPGLRFSKESLKPHHMAKKYVVTPTS